MICSHSPKFSSATSSFFLRKKHRVLICRKCGKTIEVCEKKRSSVLGDRIFIVTLFTLFFGSRYWFADKLSEFFKAYLNSYIGEMFIENVCETLSVAVHVMPICFLCFYIHSLYFYYYGVVYKSKDSQE